MGQVPFSAIFRGTRIRGVCGGAEAILWYLRGAEAYSGTAYGGTNTVPRVAEACSVTVLIVGHTLFHAISTRGAEVSPGTAEWWRKLFACYI